MVEVKVEVDRIPEDHMNKHKVINYWIYNCRSLKLFAIKELLEHANYIEEEREYLGEQLSEMEKEVVKERREREFLQEKLLSLQQKVFYFTFTICLVF